MTKAENDWTSAHAAMDAMLKKRTMRMTDLDGTWGTYVVRGLPAADAFGNVAQDESAEEPSDEEQHLRLVNQF